MRLELGEIFIKDVIFGKKTTIFDGVLVINKDELIQRLRDDKRIKNAEIDIARPGEKVRIIPVKDVIEPRVKVEGGGEGFPGVTHKIARVGQGKTNALRGVAVVTTGPIVGIQEGLIDMWGEGAKYTPFSKTRNVVVHVEPIDGLEEHEHEETVRSAGLKAASYLGEAGKDIKPDKVTVFELGSIADNVKKYPELPRVVYIEMVISQGLLHDTYIYGVDAKQILPTLIHPNEILDGAVVSGNCVAACDKITTYQHQNNPVILDLYEKHGRELNFLGVILTNEKVTLEGKMRSCSYAANLARMLGAEGAIITEEGYGNPDTDLLQICRELEKSGIKTVLITDECAGRDGLSQALADAVPEAKAIISTGNVSHLVKLPPAEKVIGSEKAISNLSGGFDESLCEDGSILCELNAIIGSTSEIGFFNLTTRLY
ncbi:glycine/sarcosine/betaine reductase component B subunit [Thermoanaerobacterium sp. DL9XJH110]|uniref:glycine/sarcosine/betaine reductase component B subunit n=1 Tax=Thermoanaerobacterium sp. DL9XJH110 TaxID=3386643 RepID=UPI003BB649C8